MSSEIDATETAAEGTEFRLLGSLEMLRGGEQVELGPPKQRAVLALLLLHANRVVPTQRLIDELWGETPPETARAALQGYIAGLRKALGSGSATLSTRAPGYVLEVPVGSLDLDRFEALRREARSTTDARRTSELLHEALSLWRDRPLAEFDGEPFAAVAADQLEERRLGAFEERIEADLALGRHAQVVPELDELVAESPYRERFRAQQMLALYRAGRQADALAAYRAGRAALAEGLGLEPSSELKALERAVLDQDAKLDPPAVEAIPDKVVAPSVRRRPRLGPIIGFALAVGALGIAVVLVLARDPASIVAPPNSVAVIDAGSRRVVAAIPVGVRPGPIVVSGKKVWIGNLANRFVTRLDADSRREEASISVPATPDAIAYGAGKLWVVHGRLGSLSVIDPAFDRRVDTIAVAGRAVQFHQGGVDVGPDAVWAVFGDATLARVDPVSVRRTGFRYAPSGSTAVLVAYESIWVSSAGQSLVVRYSPKTWLQGPVSQPVTVGKRPVGLAAGAGAIWVANNGDDTVWRIDAGPTSSATPITVGNAPAALSFGAGALWVANHENGTVSRIDPETNAVSTIEVGGAPAGVAVVGSEIWVTIQAP